MIEIKNDTKDNLAYKWVCENLGFAESEIPNTKTIVLSKEGKAIGAIVFSVTNPKNCFLSIYTISKEWATRRIVIWVINYCFEVLKVQKITCDVDKRNLVMRSILERIGFMLEGCLQYCRRDGGDACYYRFNKKSFKFSKFFKDRR